MKILDEIEAEEASETAQRGKKKTKLKDGKVHIEKPVTKKRKV